MLKLLQLLLLSAIANLLAPATLIWTLLESWPYYVNIVYLQTILHFITGDGALQYKSAMLAFKVPVAATTLTKETLVHREADTFLSCYSLFR